MKFEKITIPPGWQESFTKYPNGRTIFEALTDTITSVNEGIDAVNTKVDQGLLAIDAAADTIRSEVNSSFLILQNKLEQDLEYLQDDLVADIAVMQSQLAAVNAQLAEKANKTQEEWITPTLLNGTISNSTNTIISYRKNQFGNVEFKGRIDSVTAVGVVMFKLPEGYRVPTITYLVTNSGATMVRVRFDFNGDVKIQTGNLSIIEFWGLSIYL